MGIKDIPLSTTPPIPQGIPMPPSLESIIQTPKGSLEADPQSGSIIKLLGENGFKDKIQEGYKNGKTYTILHAAPSPDFTLIETWTETTKDDQGNTISNPRKNYQFFKIIVDTPAVTNPMITQPEPAPTEKPVEASEPAQEIKPEEPAVITTTENPTKQISEPAKESIVEPATQVQLPPTVVEQPKIDRAQEVAEKIKRGGAGMTQEDWQYRNENWPAIEKYLMPKQATPTSTPQTTPELPATPKTEPVAPQTPEATQPVATAPAQQPAPSAVPQHYDSKAWLMQKLGSPKANNPAPSTAPAQPSASSSYDLLKSRFAKTAPVASPEVAQPTHQETADQRRTAFIQSIFASAPDEWEVAKTIPARAFIYPTEYAWGNDEQGNQISRTLEDFPQNSKKLRERVAQPIEDLAAQGINTETLSLDQAIIDLFDKNIL